MYELDEIRGEIKDICLKFVKNGLSSEVYDWLE